MDNKTPQLNTDASNVEEKQAVERLRSSKTAFECDLKRSGERAGIEFVLRNADFGQMQRLQQWYDSVDCPSTAIDGWTFRNVASLMAGDNGAEGDIEETLRQKYGVDIDDEIWIEAFIDGAVNKFNELNLSI